MKKTFPANISGKIYYIEEDAYNLLQNYFTQLRTSFPGDEGREIVNDIEGRVAELFEDKLAAGSVVITISDANEVIARMGRPEELSDDEDGEPVGGNSESTAEDVPFISINPRGKKRLYRDTRNKVFGGVVSGLAEYLGWNCNIMRLLLVLLAFFPTTLDLPVGLWAFVVFYLVLWMIIPPASTSRRILEMQGRPVTVDEVGRTVLDTAAAEPDSASVPPPFRRPEQCCGGSANGFWNFVSQIFRVFGKFVMAVLLVAGSAIGIASVVVLILGLTAMVLALGCGNFIVAMNLGMSDIPVLCSYQLWALIFASLVVFVPCVALVWTACCALFGRRGASTGVVIAAVVIEILLISALVVFLNLMTGFSMAGCMFSAAAVTSVYPMV